MGISNGLWSKRNEGYRQAASRPDLQNFAGMTEGNVSRRGVLHTPYGAAGIIVPAAQRFCHSGPVRRRRA
jgi:hypothetical protein